MSSELLLTLTSTLLLQGLIFSSTASLLRSGPFTDDEIILGLEDERGEQYYLQLYSLSPQIPDRRNMALCYSYCTVSTLLKLPAIIIMCGSVHRRRIGLGGPLGARAPRQQCDKPERERAAVDIA